MFFDEYTQDWLGSRNIFYNIRTKEISDNINELIDPNHITFSNEGFNNYLQYGYCVFGQTPIEEIKILLHDQAIKRNDQGDLVIEERHDEFEDILGQESSPKDTIDYLEYLIETKEKECKSIIVPTSGGFDSRMICSLIKNKKNIKSYTYGVSKVSSESIEVVYAKKLCEILGITWEEIVLGDFIKLMDEWYSLMGISTHAHGMYQMEFYSQIKNKTLNNNHKPTVFSGILGDVWAGNWKFRSFETPQDIIELGKSYVEHVDIRHSKLKIEHEKRDFYYERMKNKLCDNNWRVLEAARTKVVLLSYLLRVPKYYGFYVWSPFLNKKLVSKMLNLDWEQKTNRKWQVSFFRERGILIGDMGLVCDKSNTLDSYGVLKNKPKLLDSKLLGQVVEQSYIEHINAKLANGFESDIESYNQYVVLYPIQRILEVREYGKV